MSTVNAAVARLGSLALTALIAVVFGLVLLRLLGVATMAVPSVFLFSEAGQDTADAGSYLVFVPMALAARRNEPRGAQRRLSGARPSLPWPPARNTARTPRPARPGPGVYGPG